MSSAVLHGRYKLRAKRPELSRSDEDVRDWATVGLGTMVDRDTEQVREALVARLEDPHQETRAEALKGLAARADTRAVESLLAELRGSPAIRLVEEALFELVARTGDERLCPEVLARQDWSAGFPDIAPPEHLVVDPVSRVDHAASTLPV